MVNIVTLRSQTRKEGEFGGGDFMVRRDQRESSGSELILLITTGF